MHVAKHSASCPVIYENRMTHVWKCQGHLFLFHRWFSDVIFVFNKRKLCWFHWRYFVLHICVLLSTEDNTFDFYSCKTTPQKHDTFKWAAECYMGDGWWLRALNQNYYTGCKDRISLLFCPLNKNNKEILSLHPFWFNALYL